MTSYEQGFLTKLAELGVSPYRAGKLFKVAQTAQLSDGSKGFWYTPGRVAGGVLGMVNNLYKNVQDWSERQGDRVGAWWASQRPGFGAGFSTGFLENDPRAVEERRRQEQDQQKRRRQHLQQLKAREAEPQPPAQPPAQPGAQPPAQPPAQPGAQPPAQPPAQPGAQPPAQPPAQPGTPSPAQPPAPSSVTRPIEPGNAPDTINSADVAAGKSSTGDPWLDSWYKEMAAMRNSALKAHQDHSKQLAEQKQRMEAAQAEENKRMAKNLERIRQQAASEDSTSSLTAGKDSQGRVWRGGVDYTALNKQRRLNAARDARRFPGRSQDQWLIDHWKQVNNVQKPMSVYDKNNNNSVWGGYRGSMSGNSAYPQPRAQASMPSRQQARPGVRSSPLRYRV